jgi:hypothetical protein
LKWLSRECAFDVDLLFLDREETDERRLADNRPWVQNLVRIPLSPWRSWRRITQELLLQTPGFQGYDLEATALERIQQQYDLVVYTPISATMARHHLAQMPWWQTTRPLEVAIANDCYTSVIRSRGRYVFRRSIPLFSRLNCCFRWLQSFPMSKLEAQALAPMDLILCQTPVDVSWFARISGGKLSPSVRPLANGVAQELLEIPLEPRPKKLLLLGALDGPYGDSALWVLEQVWPRVKRDVPDASLHVIGKSAPDRLQRLMSEDESVVYTSYVDQLTSLFADKAIMVAPILKGHGLINKVVESMAAGVVVVGDKSAFNGIGGFHNGVHGKLQDGAAEMASEVVCLLNDTSQQRRIAGQARRLMVDNFSWQSRFCALSGYLTEAFERRCTNS